MHENRIGTRIANILVSVMEVATMGAEADGTFTQPGPLKTAGN